MPTRRTLLRSIAAAALPVAGASPLASALFGLRVSSPAVVFLATLSLLSSKPLSPPSPSPITPVVVQSRVPRKSLILALLSLAALSFLVDGLAYATYAVLNGLWRPGTGVELAALLGLIAYSALAALGAYKDVNNIEIWSRKRVKAAVFVALALDIVQVALLALSVTTRDPRRICGTSKLSECIPETIHFFTPLFRVVFLVPLFLVLFFPRVVYLPAVSQPETVEVESAPLVGQPSVLLQDSSEVVSGSESSKYGTFAQQPESNTASICPQSDSSLVTLWRLGPYILPARALLLSITLLHVLTRVITLLLPLSLGAAVDAFLSSPHVPIPAPFGTSPYTYVFVFALLHFLTSDGGILNLSKALLNRLGADADHALSSHFTDHVLALALGSGKDKAPESLPLAESGVVTRLLHTVALLSAAVDDSLIGAVVLGVLFSWEFGLAVLITLGIYGYTVCLTCHPSIQSAGVSTISLMAFVQALLASGALLLGSLYLARGVTEGMWSAGAWVAWVWYWSILYLPLSGIPSLRVVTGNVRSIFKVLDKPAGVAHGKDTIDGTRGIEVKFDNVSLTYPYSDTQEPVLALEGVSFDLPASSVTAIVNASGSAKSSILKALYRLYDIDSGSISLNGTPIQSLSSSTLRSVVAAVPDVSAEGRVKAVSHAVGKDAKVILLEGPLEGAFVGGKTIVWETNGLEGVDNVDQILVLKNGQLVESGPFKDLVQADGLFTSLWTNHIGDGAPVAGSSSVTASGVAEGYDVSIVNAQPVDGQTGETSADVLASNSLDATTASIRAVSVHAPTASIGAPSIKPTASIKADSVAPSVPTKDFPLVSFPSALEEREPIAFPKSSDSVAPVAFPASSVPAAIAFPKTDDSRSVGSSSQAHARLPTSITFDTPATPPRVSTPDPASTSSSPPDAEGKRKRISSQNFQRLARRISLSTPKKVAVIPGIAGIAGVLRRDASVKASDKSNGESGATDVTGASSSAPETARNSGEISAERSEKEKEREEKKRKRKSFMEVVGVIRGDNGTAASAPSTDSEPQGASAGEA